MKTFRILSILFALLLFLIVLAADLNLIAGLLGPIYKLPYLDKAAHFLLMGIMALLLNLGFPSRRLPLLWISRTSLILLLIVAAEEGTQYFMADRTFSMLDFAADLAGILLLGELGLFLGAIMFRRKEPRESI
jgi:polysaccharide biosynthesis protein VpsQ